jgi:hypothetical protein
MRYVSNRPAAEETIGAQIKAQLMATAFEYRKILDDSFRAPKSGRLYGAAKALRRFARAKAKGFTGRKVGGVHRASAPGEAPAVWTAALRKSVRHIISRIDKMTYSVLIGVAAESGRGDISQMLEFGTSRMAPRPAWRPALAILQQRMSARSGR